MKFYIAGRYQRRQEFAAYAKQLEELGRRFGKECECVARWLTGEHEGREPELCAVEDELDLLKSDCVFFITEMSDVGYNTGGRHAELGFVRCFNLMACAFEKEHKHYSIIGPKENVFMHDACSYFEDWVDMMITLEKEWGANAKQTAAQQPKITGLN